NTTNLEEFLKLAKELGEENLTDEQKRILTLWETAEGIKNGVYKAGKEFVKGIFDFVLHPVKTIESTIDALAHPIETLDYFSKAIRDSYERDVINGDAKSRAEWFAYGLGTIGLSAVGTKGLGAVSKTGMATTKVATKAGASKVKGAVEKISGFDLLPYSPRNQLAYANVGVVPYNVVNGAGVKDQLLSLAKMESKGNAKLSPSNYPNPDPPMSIPPVRYKPKIIEEVIRMRQGKGPTTKMTHGIKNIEAHHRQQVPVKNGGILDELEQSTHRGEGNHTRHNKASQLTPSQRAKEIREHYKERGKEYILPGEGI
uniref:hypothetical protein n=1 Tax=uncultured Rummeliibacillus sp. TaxID=762292 RepID=UPI00262FEE91